MSALEQTRKELQTLLDDSSRRVDILSRTLEPALFNHDTISEALTALVRRGRQTRVRIIVASFQPVQFQGHRLIALTKRLPSAMSLRVLDQHPEWRGETLTLSDGGRGLILDIERHRVHRLDTRAETQPWQEMFERLWVAGVESPELRRLG